MKKQISIFSLVLTLLFVSFTSCKIEPEHTHSWGTSYSNNESSHWYECSECGEIKNKTSHRYPAKWTMEENSTETEERFCKDCNYRQTKDHTHSWECEDYKYDANFDEDVRKCQKCSYVEEKTHEHTTTGDYNKDSSNHWKVCSSCGEKLEMTAHVSDEGTITVPSTCAVNGTKTYKCKHCKMALSKETLPLIAHTEDTGKIEIYPTCTEKGVKKYTCTVCGNKRTEDIPATGHKEENGTVITTEPGCITNGSKLLTCSICGNKRAEDIPAVGFCEFPVDCTTGEAATSSSKFVYFGVFPKTVLPSDSTVTVDENDSVKMGANTYYKGSDGEWYANVTEKGYSSSSVQYSDGTIKSSSTRYFKVEPIKWKILTTNYNGTNNALLLAEEILSAYVAYYDYISNSNTRTVGSDTNIYHNNYKYSTIRAYLNGIDNYIDYSSTETQNRKYYTDKGFLQTAFTTSAQNLIAVTTVDNSGASTTDTGNNISKADGTAIESGSVENGDAVYYPDYTCADTEDKIFLLSIKEATETSYGFPAYDSSGSGNSRIRKPTDYAKSQSAYQSSYEGEGGWWYLRSPDFTTSGCAYCVTYRGYTQAKSVSNRGWGVVPALTISLQ